jgi:hypothetical protein
MDVCSNLMVSCPAAQSWSDPGAGAGAKCAVQRAIGGARSRAPLSRRTGACREIRMHLVGAGSPPHAQRPLSRASQLTWPVVLVVLVVLVSLGCAD